MLVVVLGLGGCARPLINADKATRPYPDELHVPVSIDVQVFRKGQNIEIVNSSPTSFIDVTLWINRRYARHVDSLVAGETVRLSLWEFYDELGEVFSAGGVFATQESEPVRLVQIEIDDETPLVGLVTIRAEDSF